MSKIAFIGLGNMGRPMASNLLKAGKELSVFDISADAVASLVQLGAKAAPSAEACVKEADVVISMLPSSPHVMDLYVSKAKILQHIKAKTLVIDCSTIAPATARTVSAAASERGLEMVDAPVSGGTAGAAAATLTFIVGGTQEAFNKAEPLLKLMGKNIFHAGESGAGQVAKICNNMLLAIHMIGTSEAINLGVKNGIDPKILCEIMSKSSGRNWSLETYNPLPGLMPNVPASRNFEGGFAVDLMAKDLGLANEAAETTHTKTPLGTLALALYKEHSKAGAGRLDFSSIIKFLDS